MWRSLSSSLSRAAARPTRAALLPSSSLLPSSTLPSPLPLLASRMLATAGPPKTVVEARAVANDTSVNEAKKVVFGHWKPESAPDRQPRVFKTLKKLQKGFISHATADFQAMRFKHNLRPPGHSEEHLIDFGRGAKGGIMSHPVIREVNNLQRLAELTERKRLGKGPPPKGQGKRKSKGK